MDKLFFLPAIKGNKGSAAARTVHSIGFRKRGIFAGQIAKFHGL